MLWTLVNFFPSGCNVRCRPVEKPLWNKLALLGPRDEASPEAAGFSFRYLNILGTRVHLGTGFYALAENSGVASILGTVIPFRKSRISDGLWFANNKKPADWPWHGLAAESVALDSFIGMCSQLAFRMFFVGSLRIALPLDLQVTLFAISTATGRNGSRREDIFSIVVAALAALPALFNVYEIALLCWEDGGRLVRLSKQKARHRDFVVVICPSGGALDAESPKGN